MPHYVLFAFDEKKKCLPSNHSFHFNEHDLERFGFTLVNNLDQLDELEKKILNDKPEHTLAHIEVRQYYEICEDSKCIGIAYEADKAEELLNKAKENSHGDIYILKCFEPKNSAIVQLFKQGNKNGN